MVSMSKIKLFLISLVGMIGSVAGKSNSTEQLGYENHVLQAVNPPSMDHAYLFLQSVAEPIVIMQFTPTILVILAGAFLETKMGRKFWDQTGFWVMVFAMAGFNILMIIAFPYLLYY